jgi:signal transduction histidine kinase
MRQLWRGEGVIGSGPESPVRPGGPRPPRTTGPREPASGPRAWACRLPWPLPPPAADAAVAAGLAIFGGIGAVAATHGHGKVWVVPIVVAMGLALFPRRTVPGLVLAAVALLAGCLVAVDPASEAGFIPVLAASYSAIVHGGRRLSGSLAAAAVALLAAAGVAAAVGIRLWFRGSVPPHLLLAAAGASIVGWVIRGQFAAGAAQLDLLAERAALTAEHQRDEAMRVRVAERLRIARELHDIVAHHITVAVIQSQAAQRIAERDPARARQAMAATERTARSALDEMRRLLNLLRSEEAGGQVQAATLPAEASGARADPLREPERAALPGIADIGPLAERVRAAGLDVSTVVTGMADRVPEDIGLAAYRIVQEALTNVLRHAGNARVRVTVDLTDQVEIIVSDDGRGAAAHLDGADVAGADVAGAAIRGAGRGVTGMAERAAAAGGGLTAGPRSGGGFEVRALMPLPRAETIPCQPPAAERATRSGMPTPRLTDR